MGSIEQSPLFKRQFKKLPAHIQDIARERVDIFIQNPTDPRLRVHKLHGRLAEFFAFSVTYSFRIIFKRENDTVLLVEIGDHDIYD